MNTMTNAMFQIETKTDWQKIWDGRIPAKFNETITFMYFMLRLLHGQLPSTAMFISFLFYSYDDDDDGDDFRGV